jgi:hypothetical protein
MRAARHHAFPIHDTIMRSYASFFNPQPRLPAFAANPGAWDHWRSAEGCCISFPENPSLLVENRLYSEAFHNIEMILYNDAEHQ